MQLKSESAQLIANQDCDVRSSLTADLQLSQQCPLRARIGRCLNTHEE